MKSREGLKTMTEAEALVILDEQFQGKEGFLAQLERGEGLDREGLARVQSALASLKGAWTDQADVPKAALLPLVDVRSRIRACTNSNPRLEDELIQLSMDLEEGVERVVFGTFSHTEEWAVATVLSSLSGMDSLALTLHHREPVNESSVDDLKTALEVLAGSWKHRSTVPRWLAGLMLSAGDLFRDHAGNYPKRLYQGMLVQSDLETIGDDVTARVRGCLEPAKTE